MIISNPKILVVDDDNLFLDLMIETLSSIGCAVTGVPGAIEALEKLEKTKFDLLITDIKMSGMDGVALFRKVRRHYPHMPVLFVTGVESPEVIGRASPDGFLAKPFRIEQIEELIKNTLKDKKAKETKQIRQVMVVDDNETFREMLADTLRYNEYVPCAVSSGTEALIELDNGKVDAVIADIKMPEMDGITLLKLIKEKKPEIPVILITAFIDKEDIVKNSLNSLADGFLRKPFQVENLVELLNNLSSTSINYNL